MKRQQARLSKSDLFKLNCSEKFILFCRNNPAEAAKHLMNIDLMWFQRIILRSLWDKKYNLLLLGRGIGKTWLLALFACLYAMLHPKVKIGVITPSFKQTEFLFDKIAEFFEDSPFLRASTGKLQRTTFRAIVRFHNGSFIEGLPLGTGDKIRGRRYNLILIDEYAFVDEDIIKKVVNPMMNVKIPGIENKQVISSTAYYPWNHYYLQYLFYNIMSENKPELYGLHEYIKEDVDSVPNAPFLLDEDVYEMMKSTTTAEIYNMENKCQFPIENVGFFSARLIDACTPREKEGQDSCPIEVEGISNSSYSMGIDAARVAGGDNFSISIEKLEAGVKKFVHGFTLNGAPYQEMIYHIRRLTQEFNIIQINMDAGGGGTTLKDLLMQPYKTIEGTVLPAILDMDDKDMEYREGQHILRMINFTRTVVNDLYMRLKADMQHRTLQFPLDIRRHSDRELEKIAKEIIETKRELLVLQAEGKGNYYTFDVPSQFKKDRATSLALATQAANDFLSMYKEESVPELATGFWMDR